MKSIKEEMLSQLRQYEQLYPLKKYDITRKIYKMPRKKTSLYFWKSEDLNFWVKEYYMQFADEVTIIKNILDNDKTINYKVSYRLERIEDIYNMYLLNNYNNYIGIKNQSIQDILSIKARKCLSELPDLIEISKKKEKILEEIVRYFGLSEKKVINKLYDKYLQENETYNIYNDIICWNYCTQNFSDLTEAAERGYNKRDKILKEILGLPSDIKLKNTSELVLYKIIKDNFPDAIYQYRAEWLGRQSLDIYIPSRKIAIEYQGEQHYNPIDFFGGQEALKKRKQLDARKKELCKKNNVKLLEWKYDEMISNDNFIRKIKALE